MISVCKFTNDYHILINDHLSVNFKYNNCTPYGNNWLQNWFESTFYSLIIRLKLKVIKSPVQSWFMFASFHQGWPKTKWPLLFTNYIPKQTVNCYCQLDFGHHEMIWALVTVAEEIKDH